MRLRFGGTLRSSLTCQPAPSRTSAAWVRAGTARASSARKTPMAAVETAGRTRATPTPRSGQTAPNRWAELKPCWRTPRGRTPFWYQTWVTPPFWPIRAIARPPARGAGPGGPRTTARPARPRGAGPPPPGSGRGAFFEPLLRPRVGLGVDRPRLLPGEVEALDQPQHPGLAVAHPEAALDQGAQVAGAPGDAAVALELRAPEDQRLERRLPALVQAARPSRARPVAQAVDALGVVAVDPVPQRLPVHARGPRRRAPAHAVQGVGQGEQAAADPSVPLPPRLGPQLRGRTLLRDRHSHHDLDPGPPSLSSQLAGRGPRSRLPQAGIRRKNVRRGHEGLGRGALRASAAK